MGQFHEGETHLWPSNDEDRVVSPEDPITPGITIYLKV